MRRVDGTPDLQGDTALRSGRGETRAKKPPVGSPNSQTSSLEQNNRKQVVSGGSIPPRLPHTQSLVGTKERASPSTKQASSTIVLFRRTDTIVYIFHS